MHVSMWCHKILMRMAKSYTLSAVTVTKKDTKPENCEGIALQQPTRVSRWHDNEVAVSGRLKEKLMIPWPSLEPTSKFKRGIAKEWGIQSNEDWLLGQNEITGIKPRRCMSSSPWIIKTTTMLASENFQKTTLPVWIYSTTRTRMTWSTQESMFKWSRPSWRTRSRRLMATLPATSNFASIMMFFYGVCSRQSSCCREPTRMISKRF
jgi:hypothetical protein